MGALKFLREERGFSQRALAREAAVAFRTIQLLESGRHDPRWSTLAKIAAVLKVPAEALLPGRPAAPGVSLAEVSERLLREGEKDWRLGFFEFVDAFRKSPAAGLASRAPDPGLSPRLLALFASSVEWLCAEAGRPAPWWSAGVPALDEPWFVSGSEALKAAALAESPAQFRRRNIFVLGNFLSRA